MKVKKKKKLVWCKAQEEKMNWANFLKNETQANNNGNNKEQDYLGNLAEKNYFILVYFKSGRIRSEL